MKKTLILTMIILLMVFGATHADRVDQVIRVVENGNIVASGNSTYTIDLMPYHPEGYFSVEAFVMSAGSGITLDYAVSNTGVSYSYRPDPILLGLTSTTGVTVIGFPSGEPIPHRYLRIRASEGLGTAVTGFYMYLLVVGGQ